MENNLGEQPRKQRLLMERALGSAEIPAYHSLMESEVHALLQRLVTAPEDHARHICRFTTGLAILVIYFHRVTSNDDEIVAHGKASMDLLVNEMAPGPPKGIWAVDVFPFLKNIPEWFPFAGFKRKAALWRAHMAEFADRSLREAMQRMIEGSAIPSLCSIIPHDSDVVAEEEYILRWAANSMFGGSVDTTSVVIQHVLLYMMGSPDKFDKAREELGRVLNGRLPKLSDRLELPYMECVLSEVLRLSCPVPVYPTACARTTNMQITSSQMGQL